MPIRDVGLWESNALCARGGSVMKRVLCLICSCLAIAGLLFVSLPAFGQEVTAAIVGTVTDPSGAPINGATVTAFDTEHGTVWTAKTNESGAYNLPRVPVGTYRLQIVAQGFQKIIRPPLTRAPT